MDLKDSPWRFHDALELRGFPVVAQTATYSGGGYVAYLGQSATEAYNEVADLQRHLWTDKRTRAVLVEILLLNPVYTLYWWSQIVVEFLPDGGVCCFFETIIETITFSSSNIIGCCVI